MDIKADARVPFPIDRVFSTYRDRIVELVPRLPNIRSIEVRSRVERDGEIDLESDWLGGGDIPKAVRGLLSESMLRWTDYATWSSVESTVIWRTDVHAFSGAVASAGKNQFVAEGSCTRIEIRGSLTIDPAKIPAPRILARTVAETATKIIVGVVSTNLLEVARGVSELLASES